MRGKIAFVLGAAVGYVLGTRAGRARYEQIKRGADALWHTQPVQKGVAVARGAIDERADELKAFIRRSSADAFINLSRQAARQPQDTGAPAASAKGSRTPDRETQRVDGHAQEDGTEKVDNSASKNASKSASKSASKAAKSAKVGS